MMGKDIWNRDLLGVGYKGPSCDDSFEDDWRERPLAFNISKSGIVVIASIPSGKGIDVMMGKKCEISLYPDGTYSAALLESWYKPSKRRGEAVLGGRKFKDGCWRHPVCETCTFTDCEAKEYECV